MPRFPELLDAGQAAELLGICRDTLRKWNREGLGPPRVRRLKRFWYSRELLKQWARTGVVTPVRMATVVPGNGKGKALTNGAATRYHR